MTDDESEKPVVHREPRAAIAAVRSDKLLIGRKKLNEATTTEPGARAPREARTERHRAWLRQAARRER